MLVLALYFHQLRADALQGDAVVQTQECTHVSEQLFMGEEEALPRQADWLDGIYSTYLDAL